MDWKELAADGLGDIERGINAALDELKELGMVGEAGAGRGFEEVSLTGVQLGHAGLAEAFGSFCERWEWGVRTLIAEGNRFAQGVGLNVGTYHETEQYVEGTFKIGANSLFGNPYATEEEVTSKSWDQLKDNHAFASADTPADVLKAKENMIQGWQDAGRDAATSPLTDPLTGAARDASGMTDEQYEAGLDEAFGPSPQERAEAAERQALRDGGDS
ncbi:hypothetical protein ACFQVC_02995 [Streptomyces monticola]|uniref:Uncharacterized protein n=1 Tax=Streptomyces monticola TaxID=2666263 RepID=A0ABW2JCB5_9ACTN